MTSRFHDATAYVPTYEFVEILERHPGDEDFKCLLDNTGGRLCVSLSNDKARYYPAEKGIRDKDGKRYPFVRLEMKLDKLVIGDKVYDYINRVYVNYNPTNPLKSGNTSPYAHGVDILRFIAAYDGKIGLDEILVNPNSPLNEKKGELNYPLVLLFERKDTNLKQLLNKKELLSSRKKVTMMRVD